MRSVTVVRLLALVAQAYSKELAASHTTDAKELAASRTTDVSDSVDELVHNLGNKLFGAAASHRSMRVLHGAAASTALKSPTVAGVKFPQQSLQLEIQDRLAGVAAKANQYARAIKAKTSSGKASVSALASAAAGAGAAAALAAADGPGQQGGETSRADTEPAELFANAFSNVINIVVAALCSLLVGSGVTLAIFHFRQGSSIDGEKPLLH